MKKLLTTLLAASSICGMMTLTACGGNSSSKGPSGYEYALVTDVGDVDDKSFNQSSWEATRDFANSKGKTVNYYRPTADSTEARLTAIDNAIAQGAKVVVCPGFLFEDTVYEAQKAHPSVKFVLIDGAPHTSDYSTYETAANTVSIVFKEEIAGYLAGYAAVKDGYTKLGYCGGMAVPAVQRYGSGFVQGADAAAAAMEKSISINYFYAGAFQATEQATLNMRSWYADGTEVVFAAGGKVYQSVVEGCSTTENGKWIGVDVDQNDVDPGRVLTSAMKGLYESVQSALEVYCSGQWDLIGGKNYNLGLNSEFGPVAPKNYVEIPTKNWNFATYTKEENEKLMADIGSGSVTISSDLTAAPTVSSFTTVNWVSPFIGA